MRINHTLTMRMSDLALGRLYRLLQSANPRIVQATFFSPVFLVTGTVVSVFGGIAGISIALIPVILSLMFIAPIESLQVWIVAASWFQFNPNTTIDYLARLVFHQAFLVSLLGILLVSAGLKHRRLAFSKYECLFAIYSLLVFLSLYLSSLDPVQGFKWFMNSSLLPALAYFMSRNLFRKRHQIYSVLITILVVSVLWSVEALFEYYLGRSFFNPAGSFLPWENVGRGTGGAFLNPAVLGAAIDVGLLVSIDLLIRVRDNMAARRVLLLMMPVLLGGLFVTLMRSAYVAFVVALFAVLLEHKQLLGRNLIMTIGLFCLVLIPAWLFVFSKDLASLMSLDHIFSRVNQLDAAWEMFRERPIFGWGYGAFDALSVDFYYASNAAGRGLVSHNSIATVASELGIFGLISYSSLWLYLFWNGTKGLISTWSSDVRADRPWGVLVGALIVYFITSMSIEMRYFSYPNALFWLLASLLIPVNTRSVENHVIDK